MSEVISKIIIDCSTGEETIVPLTEAELAQREVDAAAALETKAAQDAEIAAKAAAKADAIAALVALGLTEAQVTALTA